MAEKGTPGWVWFGCGCLLLIVGLGVVAIGGLGFLGWRMAQGVTDPENNALTILGAERLPEGYEPRLALSLPMSVQIVALDGPGRDFVYTRGIVRQRSIERLENGEIDLVGLLEDSARRSRDLVELDHGELEVDSMHVTWAALRGELDLSRLDGPSGGRVELGELQGGVEGIHTILLLQCPEGGKPRLAFWVEGAALPEDEEAAVDLRGTTGDPEQIRAFLENFDPCG